MIAELEHWFGIKFQLAQWSATLAAFMANYAVWQQWITGIAALVTVVFGAGTAVFTFLIAVRRWHRGVKLEEHLDAMKRL